MKFLTFPKFSTLWEAWYSSTCFSFETVKHLLNCCLSLFIIFYEHLTSRKASYLQKRCLLHSSWDCKVCDEILWQKYLPFDGSSDLHHEGQMSTSHGPRNISKFNYQILQIYTISSTLNPYASTYTHTNQEWEFYWRKL